MLYVIKNITIDAKFRISNILKHKRTLQFYPDSHILCFVKLVWLYDVENVLKLYAQAYLALTVSLRSMWFILCFVILIIFTAIWLSWKKKWYMDCDVKFNGDFVFIKPAHHSCSIWIFCLLQHHGQQQLHWGIKTVGGDLTGGNHLNTFLPFSNLS